MRRKIKTVASVLVISLMFISAAKAAIKDVDIKILPIYLPLRVSLGTDSLDAEPSETVKVQAFVRNAHNESMRQVKVWFENVTFDVQVTPESIDELKPDEIKSFDVSFTVPADMEVGDHVMVMRAVSRDFSVPVIEIITLRVRKMTREIYYLTWAVGFVVVAIFLWRRFKLRSPEKK